MRKQPKKQEEVVVEQEKQSDYVPIKEEAPEPIVYNHPALEEIETKRKSFYKTFRTQNTLKWVISMICMAIIIFACIGIPNIIPDNQNLRTGIMIGLVVGALAIVLLYSVLTKRGMNEKLKKYMSFYYNKVNEFVFEEKDGFKNVVLQEPGKIEVDLFKDNNLYKDVIDVRSRGLTEFEYNEIPMRIVECSGQVKAEKMIKPVFVGKMLQCATSYTGEQTIVIYFKGNERALPPTNTGELKVLVDNTKYTIWSNYENYKKVIKANILKMFDKIEMNKYLVDLAISMHDGKMFVCFGYDDPLMVLPLQQQFNPKPNEQYKEDLATIIKLVEALH